MPYKPSRRVENHQIRILVQARHRQASATGLRIPQGLSVAAVYDEVAVALEHHQAASVAVGARLGRVPEDTARIGVSEDDDVGVAVKLHMGAEVEVTDGTGAGQFESPGCPSLVINSACCGGEEED